MEVSFVVYGEPVAKGRPKFARMGNQVRAYTPAKTANYEALVKWEYMRQCGGERFPDGEYVDAKVMAYYGIPQSVSKKRRGLMESGEIRPTKKPDLDNVIKSICDSLNDIAYKDDSQIVHCDADKFYSEQPRVEVILRTAERMEE